MKTCFFIGHREAPEGLYPALYDAVLRHIEEYSVTDYVVGHYGRFDALAASAVRAAKKTYPDVQLCLLLPYHPAERQVCSRSGMTACIIRLAWRQCPGGLRLCGPTGTWSITVHIPSPMRGAPPVVRGSLSIMRNAGVYA